MTEYYYDDEISHEMLRDRNMRLQTRLGLDTPTGQSDSIFEDKPLFGDGSYAEAGQEAQVCHSSSTMGSSNSAFKITGQGDGIQYYWTSKNSCQTSLCC